MNADELAAILDKHKKWLIKDSDGERANLRGANLRGANLSEADLSEADLSRADLRDADLRWADLIEADLSEADLRWADLIEADLSRAKGLLLLPVQDMRGHSFIHAVQCGDEWRIRGGCRDFSIAEAKDHFGERYKDREFGDLMLYAIDWLEAKINNKEETT